MKKIPFILVIIVAIVVITLFFTLIRSKSTSPKISPDNEIQHAEKVPNVTLIPHDIPVGRVLFAKVTSDQNVRYLDKDGVFYEFNSTTKQTRNLTKEEIPLPSRVVWSENGQKAFIEPEDREADVLLLDFVSQSLKSQPGNKAAWINSNDYYLAKQLEATVTITSVINAKTTPLTTLKGTLGDLTIVGGNPTVLLNEVIDDLNLPNLVMVDGKTQQQTIIARSVVRIISAAEDKIAYLQNRNDKVALQLYSSQVNKTTTNENITHDKVIGQWLDNTLYLTVPSNNFESDRLVKLNQAGTIDTLFTFPKDQGPFIFQDLGAYNSKGLLGSSDGLLYFFEVK